VLVVGRKPRDGDQTARAELVGEQLTAARRWSRGEEGMTDRPTVSCNMILTLYLSPDYGEGVDL
jgi:hypothetical protein